MKGDFVDKEMERYGADGVDFVPLLFNYEQPFPIYESHSKEEWATYKFILKTNRVYWKLDENGNKRYIKR